MMHVVALPDAGQGEVSETSTDPVQSQASLRIPAMQPYPAYFGSPEVGFCSLTSESEARQYRHDIVDIALRWTANYLVKHACPRRENVSLLCQIAVAYFDSFNEQSPGLPELLVLGPRQALPTALPPDLALLLQIDAEGNFCEGRVPLANRIGLQGLRELAQRHPLPGLAIGVGADLEGSAAIAALWSPAPSTRHEEYGSSKPKLLIATLSNTFACLLEDGTDWWNIDSREVLPEVTDASGLEQSSFPETGSAPILQRNSQILDLLLQARNEDWVELSFNDGRTLPGRLVFNEHSLEGTLINPDEEYSIHFTLEQVTDVKI